MDDISRDIPGYPGIFNAGISRDIPDNTTVQHGSLVLQDLLVFGRVLHRINHERPQSLDLSVELVKLLLHLLLAHLLNYCSTVLRSHRIPDPSQLIQFGAGLFRSKKGSLAETKKPTMSLGPALASPSTLNTPFHTLSCTAFAIASAVDEIALKVPGPRAV